MSAFALERADCALGAFCRRIKSKYGSRVAITATAHKLARIIYKMLKFKVSYKDVGAEYYNKKYKEKIIKNLNKRAEKFGYKLVSENIG